MIDRGELQLRLELLRGELPAGAPVLPVPSIRARDRSEVVTGLMFDLGLASARLGDELLGEAAQLTGHVYVARGLFTGRSFTALEPLLAQHLEAQEQVALVSDDVDEAGLMVALINRQKAGLGVALLTPTGGPARGIDAFSRALGLQPNPNGTGTRSQRQLTLLATLHACAVLDPQLPGAGPMGIFWTGGDDLAHARERARVARELLHG